jgi:hypothetical protein
MANTVSLLSYANTFGDQMVVTNALVNENNTLATGNYTKKTGTLTLTDPSLALQANGPVILYNSLQSLGTGSSVSIQNNLAVTSGQVYFQNTVLGLTNSGELISNGKISAWGSGLGLNVANNTQIGGFLAVVGNTSVVGPVTMANTLAVTGATSMANTLAVTGATTIGSTLAVTNNGSFGNNVTVVNNATAYNLIAQNNTNTSTLNVTTNATIGGNTTVGGTTTIGGSASVAGTTWSNFIQSNTSVNTATLSVTGTSYTNNLQANSNINTVSLSATGNAFVNILQANTSMNTRTISVTGTAFANNIQSNSSINTVTINATGNVYGDVLQSNTSVNTATLSVTGTSYTNNLQANSRIIVGTTSGVNTIITPGTILADTVSVNTAVSIPTLSITTQLNANAASVFVNNLQTLGQLSVGGNFLITGSTVYGTNTFTLNANSSTGVISTYAVNRGSSGANAAIRWNEPSAYWDIKDVSSNTYYRILTTQQITDNLISTSTNTAASANAANALNTYVNTNVVSLQNQITSNVTSLQSQITSNVTSLQSQIQSNSAISGAGITAAYTRANASSQLFTGTNGSTAAPNTTTGGITFTSTNGVTITGSANTITISDPQDLRTSASPTFNGLTLTNALAVAQGGTGATSAAQALSNLLPTTSGVPSGYVLGTGGGGGTSFYWTAGGSGGGSGAIPGTTIASSRQTYTGNGAGFTYTTPVYVPGTAQVRAYINGVRQNPSEYTETSGNTSGSGIVTFTTAPQLNDAILFEVDGYINNPYYANNIAYTVNPSISSTANTIQLAIDGLTSVAAPKASPQLTGIPLAVTATLGTSNTMIATTAFVNNLANSGYTLTHSITGNAGTVTNGVYTNQNYYNPSWLSQIPGGIVNGGVALATSANTLSGVSIQSSGSVPSGSQVLRSDVNGYAFLNSINSNTTNSENPTVSQVIVTNGTDNYYRKSAINGTGGFGSQLTTLGTITTGTWNGSVIGASYGGTGVAGTLTGVLYGNSTSAQTVATSAQILSAIGTTANMQINSLGVGTTASSTAGEIRATNNITAYYSDDRLKTRLNNIENALNKVMSLNGFHYKANETAQALGYQVKPEVGLSAQEVQKVLPEVVVPAPIDSKYLTIHYERVIPLLVEAIKELKAEIDELKGNNK